MTAPRDMIGTTALQGRGWTPAMIRDLLGEPDETRPNPRYRSAAPMRLWYLERVETVEASPAFADRRRRGERRSEASIAAAGAKRKALLLEVEDTPVDIPQMSWEDLVSRACAHYNARTRDRETDLASPDSNPDFLDRITVNYLRHELTSYDGALDALYRRIGRKEAAVAIRERILSAIADTYPSLAPECRRQEDARDALS